MRDLEADLKLCEMATKGPWYLECSGGNLEYLIARTIAGNVYAEPMISSYPPADAEFIVQAREGWPWAISQVLSHKKTSDHLTDIIEGVTEILEVAGGDETVTKKHLCEQIQAYILLRLCALLGTTK